MKQIEYIKISDEHTALSLISSGFSYMEEYINGGQKIFVFEKSVAIEEKIGEIALRENKDVCLVQEGILRF